MIKKYIIVLAITIPILLALNIRLNSNSRAGNFLRSSDSYTLSAYRHLQNYSQKQHENHQQAVLESREKISIIGAQNAHDLAETSNKSTSNRFLVEKWEDLFPDVVDMMQKVELSGNLNDPSRLTDARKTIVEIREVKENEYIKVLITAKDFLNRTKNYGGDYYRVNLIETRSRRNGVACRVRDLRNGSYVAGCPLVIPEEKLTIHTHLIHPSESLYVLIKNVSSTRQPINDIVTIFLKPDRRKERSVCNVDFNPDYRASDLCNYTLPNTRASQWYCVKPRSGNCGPIFRQIPTKPAAYILHPHEEVFQRNKTFCVDVTDREVLLDRGKYQWGKFDRPPCTNDQFHRRIQIPVGYYHDNQWTSLLCRNTYKYIDEPLKFQKCLDNKVVYLIGDSTSRQWYKYFEEVLNMRTTYVNKGRSSTPRIGTFRRSSGVIKFYVHGQPIRLYGPPVYHPFISDVINSIDDDNAIVVISIGLHFVLYHPSVFIERIHAIKLAVIDLLQRKPATKVFIKDITMYISNDRCPSPWLALRFNNIIEREFSDVIGVKHLNVWDMSSLRLYEDVHPPIDMVKDQIALFQSHICNN